MLSTLVPHPTSASRPSRGRCRSSRPGVEALEGRALLSGPGSLDPTFGSAGIVTTAFSGKDAHIRSLLLQPDGKLVAVGTGMARYNSNGALDTSFGSKGKVANADGAGALYPAGTANAGRIVTGGAVSTKAGNDFSLTRYNSNGSVDAT